MKSGKKQWKVQTKGFTNTFSSEEEAKKAYEKEKDKRIKNEQTFTISLKEREGVDSDWVVVDEAKIGEGYYLD